MDILEAFLRGEHAGEIMIALGALLVVVGTVRILKSSLTLAFWVLLCGLGTASVSYGMKRSELELPPLPGAATRVADRFEDTKALSVDVLRVLCERLEDYGAS